MPIRTILKDEDPVLTKKCHPVVKFDNKLADLIDDMIQTLQAANGVGLAAPQIGIVRRVVIVMDDEGVYHELVNPKILSTDGIQNGLEGCLSLPGIWGYVERPMTVTVEAQDRTGETYQLTGEGLMARCFCHELEHLDGIIYTTHCDRTYTADEIDEMEQENEKEKGKK